MDPNYPIDNFTICHRRPPQADFEVVDRLLPRTQDLRFEEDQYTPLWVRQDGKDKEGWCALCPGNGKWLQLKNSAFWYHRQFQHGISSSSGVRSLFPLSCPELSSKLSNSQGFFSLLSSTTSSHLSKLAWLPTRQRRKASATCAANSSLIRTTRDLGKVQLLGSDVSLIPFDLLALFSPTDFDCDFL